MKTSRALVAAVCAAFFMLAGTGCNARSAEHAFSGKLSKPDEQAASADRLYKLTEQLYAAAKEENRQLAYSIVGRIAQTVSQDGLKETGNAGGWQALKLSLKAAGDSLAKERAVSDWNLQAARLKLAADSLVRPEAPVWLQYKNILDDDWDRLIQAWQSPPEQRVKAAIGAMSVYKGHELRFEVAALLQRPEKQVRAFEAQIAFTEQLIQYSADNGRAAKTMMQTFEELKASADRLFEPPGTEADESKLAAVAPMDRQAAAAEQLATMFIAAIVMGILGLAGWQKFVYEKRNGTVVPPRGGGKRS